MYTPTEKELLEMGFKRKYDGTWLREGVPNLYYYIDERKFFATGLEFFPRSKEHLEQIILAFTKPE